ncbi:MAG TPA: bifunctional adenosylcobinamide kinase/adenosylcobinamide-phosphate guanylyltransferase [Dissulfurispiraceae bacterium]
MADKKGWIIFVIGGARSGKSGFALSRASAHAGTKAYIATAQAFDDEMRERIEKHRSERGGEWKTFEEPLHLAALVKDAGGAYDVLLIDCLTLWVSNLLLAGKEETAEIESLQSSLRGCSSTLYIVSNEVGMGIVPDNPLARKFRDVAGHLNQKLACIADEVYLVAAGVPLKLK